MSEKTVPDPMDRPNADGNPATLAVLIIDDEPLIRWSLRRGFADRGHAVQTAGTGADALAAIANAIRPFDAIVLDCRLPDRRDLSLLEDMRLASPHAVVVMMTACSDADMRSLASSRGACAVIDKPFNVEAIVSLVETSTRA